MQALTLTTSSRRLKRLIVTWELARNFIVTGQHERRYNVFDGVPPDAELVNVRHAWPHCIELLLVSDAFEEVKEGEEIPLLHPFVTTDIFTHQ